MNIEHFKTELDYIVSPDIKEFAELAINNLPDYFFVVAASSTGKYHPKYSLGVGGLLRHTKAVAFLAWELLQLETYSVFTQREKDLIITAAILHDGKKQGDGKSGYTVADHPTQCGTWLRTSEIFDGKLSESEMNYLTGMIETHMGQWNTQGKKEILKKPSTKEQRFLHVCDYLASRKKIEVKFDTDEDAEQPFDVMSYTMPFGKHSGKTVGDLIKEDKSYLRWLTDSSNNTRINRDILKEIKKVI